MARQKAQRTAAGRGAAELLVFVILAITACGIADEGKLPPDVQDPASFRTPSGALARYREAVGELPLVFDGVMLFGGILTDELAALPVNLGTTGPYTDLDSRSNIPDLGDYKRLHKLRAQARDARGFLSAYAPDISSALRGHLYAAEGYAEIFLADLFCSGIPLSTVDFNGNYTLAAGSTTREVYEHALTLFAAAFDSTGDSVRLQHLASVGKGRALLALGRYGEAAAAVAGVPDDYRYQLTFGWGVFATSGTAALTSPPDSAALLWYGTRLTTAGGNAVRSGAPSVGNQEGGNGLDYRASGDPRTLAAAKGTDGVNTFFFPRKYTSSAVTVANPVVTSPTTFTMASGIEARLIEAEAALQAGDGAWLSRLNHLRQTAWTSIVPATTGPLPDLTDPGPDAGGTDSLRVNLLFRERAFWLYLTGHRQGDLRRLVRQYVRNPDTVYPAGTYQGGGGFYGFDVVLPVPDTERQLNSKYTGCVHQNA